MNLTDKQIRAIIHRYAHNVQTANQKEDGWMIEAMRRALSDYWPDEMEARVDQARFIANGLASALDISEPMHLNDMLDKVRYMKAELDRLKK